MNNVTCFCKHDQVHCRFPGLFRSIDKKTKNAQKLDITYEFGTNEWVRVTCHEPLGAPDMRILQVIVALAGLNGVELSPQPDGEISKNLKLSLKAKFDDAVRNSLVVKTTMYRLLMESGLTKNGRSKEDVMESIRRLSQTVWIIRSGSREIGGFTTLSYNIDKNNGQISIALNPRLTAAIMGGKGSQFANINMHEVRSLKSDSARLIHQRLCAYINPGKTHPSSISIDTLLGYVWVDKSGAKINSNTAKSRVTTIKKAINELISLGWMVEERARGRYVIGRPYDVLASKRKLNSSKC